MAIQQSELKFYKSKVVNDTSANGGAMSSSQIASGAVGNLFPPVSQAERVAGVTRHRKLFCKVANDADLTLNNAGVFVENYTPGDDRITIFAATQTDTQSGITGSERKYGCGKLDANVIAGATSITVLVEQGATVIFVNGDTIRISDKADINAAGNEEDAVISGVPSVAGDVVTITLAAGLANGYSASNTRVASVMAAGDVIGAVSGWAETSAAGTYDEATYPVVVDSIGGVQDTFTLTFTSATAFNIAGAAEGSLGSGTISGDTAPNNATFGKPYWTLQSEGFGGTWATGDTIVFTTSPAAAPVWVRQVVPAGADSISVNVPFVALRGESA